MSADDAGAGMAPEMRVRREDSRREFNIQDGMHRRKNNCAAAE
jgi:hypothetical protein